MNMLCKKTIGFLVAGSVLTLITFAKSAPGSQSQNRSNEEIEVLPAQGNIYMLVGAGGSGNTTVQVGKDGVLLVDTQLPQNSEKILAAIHRLTDKPIREIINTSGAADHIGGNEKLAKAGARLGFVQQVTSLLGSGAIIRAHLNVLDRMSAPTGKQPPVPSPFWPTDAFSGEKKDLYFNGESIRLLHQPGAYTDGDIIISTRRTSVRWSQHGIRGSCSLRSSTCFKL